MDGTELRGSLRDMWDTRPARPREGRQLAGVAAAIARRYDIDPVLVRIALAVSAFYGVGIVLYLVGWLVLPDAGGDGWNLPRPVALIWIAVLGVIGAGTLFAADGGIALPTVAALGLLFLLHRSRGQRRPVAPEAERAMVSLVKQPAAPAWDPLGAAPFAWDLPEPSPAPPPPAVRRPPVTAVTLALALLAGGVTALIQLAFGVLTPSSMPVLFGVVLAVLGLGLVVGSFVPAGRGLIPAAILVGTLTWATVAAPLENWPTGGPGEFRVAPTTAAQLLPAYTASAGEFDLDLTGLDLGTGTAPVATSIEVGAGDVQIRVPADADVTFTGSVGLGHVGYATGQESTGPDARVAIVDDLGADGVASGRPLEITVTANVGNVEVRRG